MRHDIMLLTPKVIFLVVLGSAVGLSQSTWTKKPTSTSKGLLAVKFRTQTDGWAVGSKGAIIHTTDGGESWKEDSVEYNANKPLLWFVEPQDSLNIWTGYWNSPWFRSTNGGSTWTPVWIDSIANISRVVFVNPNLAFAAGIELAGNYRGRILRSTDRGKTWEAVLDTPHRGFYDICFVDSLFGVAVGAKTPVFDNFDPATIFRTTDAGNLWTEVDVPGSGPLDRVSFSNKNTGWAGGENGRLLLTTDGGLSWIPQTPSASSTPWLSSVATTGPSQVWVTPVHSDVIFHSTDYGMTWTTIQFSTGTGISGLFFSDPYHGWAAGDSGNLWKYDFVTAVRDIPGSTRPLLFLQSNYPNPFNPSTTIRFSLPTASFTTLRVFDVLGRLVATLTDSYLPAGEHEAVFDGENLPSGVYVYALNAQNQFLVGKMILSK